MVGDLVRPSHQPYTMHQNNSFLKLTKKGNVKKVREEGRLRGNRVGHRRWGTWRVEAWRGRRRCQPNPSHEKPTLHALGACIKAGAKSTQHMSVTHTSPCCHGLQVIRERYLRDDIWCVGGRATCIATP